MIGRLLCRFNLGAVTFYETKGFMRDDAIVKIKTAAKQFPMFTFVLVTRKKKSEGGAWVERVIG
jgi:hypothetical protein